MNDKETFKALAYMMAAEKLETLLFQIKNLMDFIKEYDLQADNETKQILEKEVGRLSIWLKSQS